MKIKIKLQKSSSVDLKEKLSNRVKVTDLKIIDAHCATCNIPQEPITPGGMINAIFNMLGGTNDVKSITLTK